jgi:hypothetical protein
MDYKATLMALVLVSSALAGCTGDPDGGGGDEIDSDALQDLFDEHFQDFLNNTTITVVNNYHNNTTYVVDDGDYSSTTNVEYNNTTINEGDETSTSTNNYNNQTENDYSSLNYSFGGASFGTGVNGTVTGGNMMFVAHVTFSAMDLFPDYETADYRNNTFTYNYTYYDYLTNQERTEDFTFSCQVYYLIGSLSNGSTFQVSYWNMVANGSGGDNYWNAWDNEYNNTIADLLEQAGWDHDVRSTCDEGYIATMPIKSGTDGWGYNFLSIDIPQGYAIEYLQLNSQHDYYGCTNWLAAWDCTDPDSNYYRDRSVTVFYNYSEGVNPGYQDWFYGGWENITIDFDIKFSVYNNPGSSYHGSGSAEYSVWPTSVYEFTLYYQFVPVIPIE